MKAENSSNFQITHHPVVKHRPTTGFIHYSTRQGMMYVRTYFLKDKIVLDI